MKDQDVSEILRNHIPANTFDYCMNLWRQDPFLFKLRKSRITKAGDFVCHPGRSPRITVNADLPPLSFLITFIHEVAHLDVHRLHGHRAEAHGKEWKEAFRRRMEPVMNEKVFPPRLLDSLRLHMRNPKASTYSDSRLTAELRKYEARESAFTLLSELKEGSTFSLHGRWFKKGKLRRTRVLCREVNSSRNYLVPADAPVECAQLSFF